MKVTATQHFIERSEERLKRDSSCLVSADEYNLNTFKTMVLKRIKKNIIHPRDGNRPNTFKALYQGVIYVYGKNLGEYTLITTYTKTNNFAK